MSETIFSTIPLFPYVPHCDLDNNAIAKINTKEFLEASSGMVILLEQFGEVFVSLLPDLKENIQKIALKYEENEELHQYLENFISIVRKERYSRVINRLLQLQRILVFASFCLWDVLHVIKNNSSVEQLTLDITLTKEFFEEDDELKLNNITSRFTLNKKQLFYQFALEQDIKDDQVLADMKMYNVRMSECLQQLIDLYAGLPDLQCSFLQRFGNFRYILCV